MSERTIDLPNGLEPMSEEDITEIWKKANDAYGDHSFLSSDVIDLVNALEAAYAQIDSLQQQVKKLSEYKVSSKQFGELYDKAIAVVRQNESNKKKSDDNYRALLEDAVQLRDQLAERDRTIDRLRKSLEATIIPFKFYADPHTYDPAHLDKLGYIIIDEDGGASAKDALAAVLRALGSD
ncbi:hypothetical protein ACYCS5_27070 [Paenibacillus sp. SEL3]